MLQLGQLRVLLHLCGSSGSLGLSSLSSMAYETTHIRAWLSLDTLGLHDLGSGETRGSSLL